MWILDSRYLVPYTLWTGNDNKKGQQPARVAPPQEQSLAHCITGTSVVNMHRYFFAPPDRDAGSVLAICSLNKAPRVTQWHINLDQILIITCTVSSSIMGEGWWSLKSGLACCRTRD